MIAFDILRYELQYRVQGRGAFLAHEAGGAETEATVQGLTEATTYEMRVRAVNELGSGDWSDTAAGTTRHPAPMFVEGEAATREVPENTPGGQKIGAPLTATSGAAAPRYALGGADAAAFGLDADTGQLRTRAGVSYDHEQRSRYALTVTAKGPSGAMARIAVTVLVTDVDEPPDAPAAPWVVEAGPTWLKLRWAAPGNTGPPIVDYDLEYRRSGRAFADAGHDGPATDADVTGLRPETRHTLRVRAVNDEGTGPWSLRAFGDTTRVGTTNHPPRALPSLLTVEATATARGRVETFRAQDAFLDGDGEHLYIEAVSRDPSIASAAFEGAAVAVRPRAAGRATIAVTATDAHDHAAVATFDIDVREPAASDPAAELAGDTLTVSFTAFYDLDEHRAYEVAFRQKAPRGPWNVHCIDTHNSSDSSGDRDVSTRIDVGAHFEPGVTYEVVYRRVGCFCIIARYAPVWSRVAEVTAPGAVAFDLDLRFVGPAPAAQRAAIAAAADEWTRIIRTSLPDVDFWSQRVPAGACLPGQPTVLDIVDDLRVYVWVQPMDGVGGTLAPARTCYYRQASGLPILSAITFDGDDLALRSTEETRRLAMHELAHALGFGMQWHEHSLVRHASLDVAGEPVLPTPDAHFTGRLAGREFAAAGGQRARGIPVENTGGPGSMDGHCLAT